VSDIDNDIIMHMQQAIKPENEDSRIEALHRLAILDTEPETRFDILTKEAVKKLNVKMSMVSIIDSEREWFKSCVGIDQKESPRSVSFCGHALLATNMFIVEDTLKDPRFADNPMVTGYPYIRFYAGVALFDNQTNLPIGVFCVKDTEPKILEIDEVSTILDLAHRAEVELNNVK
jgi:GAF domain-containing protein